MLLAPNTRMPVLGASWSSFRMIQLPVLSQVLCHFADQINSKLADFVQAVFKSYLSVCMWCATFLNTTHGCIHTGRTMFPLCCCPKMQRCLHWQWSIHMGAFLRTSCSELLVFLHF
ncbi:UNVERIFIED_CONTAM: hypothetical protein K2H54_036844 [Gekko kuhli]